jgi:hypothetical protein
MQTSRAILLGSIAAFALLTAPALAKTSNTQSPSNIQSPSNTQSADTTPASSGCYSSQQNADGSWTQLPCQELGQPTPPAPRKSAARSVEPATH